MRPAAATVVAAGVLLGGCATKTRAARVTVPGAGLQPVMQRQVLNAVDAGEGNPRVRELRKRMAEEPGDRKARLELAAEYGKTGHAELELEHLRLAAERFPKAEDVLVALTRALLQAKQVGEAAQRLGEYVAAHPEASAMVLSWAGIAQDELGNHVNGEALHRRAAALEPKKDTLHNNLGYSLLMQGKKAEAAEEFRRALELNPGSETARNNLGMALAEEAGAALTQFRQTSDLGVAHNNLAAYLYEKGDLDGARRELELALEYRRDKPEILENLRKVAALDGKPIRMPAGERGSFWKSIARGLKTTFVSGEERRSAGTAEAAR